MTTEERVLTALRREQPDRVPVFLYLNPYVDGWYTAEPSYAAVLEACREYADVIYDWGFPSGFFSPRPSWRGPLGTWAMDRWNTSF